MVGGAGCFPFAHVGSFGASLKEHVRRLLCDYLNAKLALTREYTDRQTMDAPQANDQANGGADVLQVEEASATDEDVPSGWYVVPSKDSSQCMYVRVSDGVVASHLEALELNAPPSVVKQEYYLSAPAIVKFYEDRISACTDRQALDIVHRWFDLMHAVKPGDQTFTLVVHSKNKYQSPTTSPVALELALILGHDHEMHATLASTKGDYKLSFETPLETYDLPLDPTKDPYFPTLLQVVKHIPGMYEEMETAYANGSLRTNAFAPNDRVVLKERRASESPTPVMIKASPLCVDTRTAIVELDSEEAELSAKLEALRKRKRDLEETVRNVRTPRNN